MPRLFAQSKIVLGVGTIGNCRDFCALKMRDFDAPMSGSLYLTQANPDLTSLFEVGAEIVAYRTIEECVEIARQLLANPATREAIARRGLTRARRMHTWGHRFDDLLRVSMGATDRDASRGLMPLPPEGGRSGVDRGVTPALPV